MRSFLEGWCKYGAVLLGIVMALCAGSAAAGSVSYTYDSLGRLTRVAYSNGTVITYVYDAVGNRSSVVVTGAP